MAPTGSCKHEVEARSLRRQIGVSEVTYYRWRQEFRGRTQRGLITFAP